MQTFKETLIHHFEKVKTAETMFKSPVLKKFMDNLKARYSGDSWITEKEISGGNKISPMNLADGVLKTLDDFIQKFINYDSNLYKGFSSGDLLSVVKALSLDLGVSKNSFIKEFGVDTVELLTGTVKDELMKYKKEFEENMKKHKEN